MKVSPSCCSIPRPSRAGRRHRRHNAGELISEVALAIETGADAADIGLTVHRIRPCRRPLQWRQKPSRAPLNDLYLAEEALRRLSLSTTLGNSLNPGSDRRLWRTGNFRRKQLRRADFAIDFDSGAMRNADGAHDRQPESRAPVRARASFIDAVEAVENVRQRGGGYADAGIPDLERLEGVAHDSSQRQVPRAA